MKIRHMMIAIVGALGYCLSAEAAMVAAKKDGVKVTTEPSNSSKTLVTLKKDEAVESIERQGMYWKVKTGEGNIGFVSFLKVNRQAGQASSLSKAIRNAALDSRDMDEVKSARSRSAVMGIRGLDESSDSQFAGSVRPNMRLVYMMEDRVPDADKIEKIGLLVQKEISAKYKAKGEDI